MRPMIDVTKENTTLFSLISIETGAKCNRTCSFCPVSVSPREDEWMPLEMIEKILSDLVQLDYKKRVALYSYNEPMRDERLVEIIKKFRDKLPRVCMMINTNGDYIKTQDDIAKYYYAGLNQMQINVYNSADGSGNAERIARGEAKCKERYEFLKGIVDSITWLDQEESIYQYIGPNKFACQVVPKWGFQPTTDHDNHAPNHTHGISKRHHIANRAGNIPDFMPPLDASYDKMCIRPFRTITINWRGDAFLCCNAYSRHDAPSQASFGNVMDKSVEELWNDERFHIYRVKLRGKNRDIYLCDKCDYDGGFYQHNVQHVTFGEERDREILNADLRSAEAIGFAPQPELVQIRKK
jgi:MoaA/NifB/PqqE/SkfB family radical SAM enzyme